jgi:Arc/MetJ-type ribon-helix-helix transcriptional regulator
MEKREFKIDKSILHSIIQKQAGSLEKAFLELVMNAVDAGSTKVDITLDAKTFLVQDDGKGFASRFEIENFFETFGTPHEEGDAKFGRFRMGRGQAMSFGGNVWRSGEFEMFVDIKNEGLNYVLKEGLPAAKGCSISGTLYNPLQPSDLLRVCRGVEAQCKYAPIPIFLNGKRISLDLEKEKWTFVDENGYYLLKESSRGMDVYNLGVFVRTYPPSQFGTGGLVVSKKQLEVNFARNDVLQAECAVFKEMSRVVRQHVRLNEGKKERKTASYKDLLATRLMAGDIADEAEFVNVAGNEKLFVDVCGAQYSLAQLYSALNRFTGSVTVAPKEGSIKADKIQQGSLALVIAPKTLDRFGVSSLEELFTKLVETADTARVPKTSQERKILGTLKKAIKAFDSLALKISDVHKLVDLKGLKRDEKMVFDAVKAAQYWIYRQFDRMGHNREERVLKVGESETANGWTDGETFIAVNRDLLKIAGFHGHALVAFEKLGTLLMHEYCHNTDDSSGHLHDEEFKDLYERVSCTTGAVGEFINRALDEWLKAVKKDSTRALRKGELDEMDRHAAVNRDALSADQLAA